VRPDRGWRRALAGLAVFVAAACTAPATPFDVVDATIAEVQEAVLSGRVSCREVVQAYLDRIDAYDQSTGLNAITVVNPDALTRADEADAAVAARGELGPLFCVPVLVKDNFDTHDLPTTGGSIALMDSRPPDDAFMVRRIREAGAIVLAKTNMAEWAFMSSSYGTTANAYALDRVPAGSSGGTASGVAASFGLVGLGSDTGNSIRGPSSHLALFGIRSTIGLTSRDGVIPLSFDRDIAGPMTRTVEDGARLFNVVAGYDPADPYTELGRDLREADYTTFLDPTGLEGKRLGVLRALVDTEDADTAVVRVFETALEDLALQGAEIIDPFVVPDWDELLDAPMFCRRFRYDMRQYLLSLGEGAPIQDVREADFAEHPDRQAFLAAVIDAMDAERLDAVVYPTWTTPPAHLDRAIEEYAGDNSQRVAPATGLPAVSVPMGYTYGGLPAGLQILARPYQEGLLFTLAYAYERGTRHRHPPEGFPPLSEP
jgi:Asp-tRNA(Asn)/Glu-tRNA(Gln) amidotransferase A subunit family amidase